MKKDFLGNELQVGDDVILIEQGYRNFIKGKIVRETPFYFFIKYLDYDKYREEIKQKGYQLIKI